MFKRSVVLLALLSAFSAFASDNLVTCGSFECETMPKGDYGLFRGTSFYGWDVTSGPGIELRNNLVGTAQSGDNFVELDSDANSSIEQSIHTVVGQTYKLEFYGSSRAANRGYNYSWDPVHGVVPGSTNGLTATFGTSTVAIATPTNTSRDNEWTLYSTTFKATSSTTDLTFAATGLSDSYGSSLDSISVVSVVPEPASRGMLVVGLLMVLAFVRRRSGTQ